jgi:hypothetical protein
MALPEREMKKIIGATDRLGSASSAVKAIAASTDTEAMKQIRRNAAVIGHLSNSARLPSLISSGAISRALEPPDIASVAHFKSGSTIVREAVREVDKSIAGLRQELSELRRENMKRDDRDARVARRLVVLTAAVVILTCGLVGLTALLVLHG